MAGGGGAWKVAYADFVTAMMAFFLVMWIVAQNKAVKESVAQYFENPLGSQTDARATSLHGIEGASADAELEGTQAGPMGAPPPPPLGDIAKGQEGENSPKIPPALRIFEKLDQTRTAGTVVLFAEEGSELDTAAKTQIRALIPSLLGKPNKIELRGHVSRRAIPSGQPVSRSWELCYQRCLKVMDFMIENGIEPNRFRLSQDGKYESYHKAGDQPTAEMNSRVEIFALGEFVAKHKDTSLERAGNFVQKSGEELYTDPPAPKEEEGHGGHGDAHGGEAAHDAHVEDPHGKPAAGKEAKATGGKKPVKKGAAAEGTASGHDSKEADHGETAGDDGHGLGPGNGNGKKTSKDSPKGNGHANSGKEEHGKEGESQESHGEAKEGEGHGEEGHDDAHGGHGEPAEPPPPPVSRFGNKAKAAKAAAAAEATNPTPKPAKDAHGGGHGH